MDEKFSYSQFAIGGLLLIISYFANAIFGGGACPVVVVMFVVVFLSTKASSKEPLSKGFIYGMFLSAISTILFFLISLITVISLPSETSEE